MMDQKAYRELGISLYRRIGEGILLPNVSVKIGDWRPQPKMCYSNVDYWIERHPHHKRVLGFAYFNASALSFLRFAAHCVVEIEDGQLIEITPHGALGGYPFIRHTGTYELFHEAHLLVNIDVPLPIEDSPA
jgi:hypothetical protein